MSDLLQGVKEECIDSVYSSTMNRITAIKGDLEFIKKPDSIENFTRYINALGNLQNNVAQITLTFSLASIKDKLEAKYESEIANYNRREIEINDRYEALINNTVVTVKSEVDEYNSKVKSEFEDGNKVYIQLEEKRKKLEFYKDDIIDICTSYGVTTSDVEIDNNSFTIEELDTIYDQYLEFLSKSSNRRNFIGVFRDKVSNPLVQGSILILIILTAFTLLLDIAAVAVFALIAINQINAKKKMKSYAVLLSLLFNVRPLEMGFKSEIDPEVIIPEDMNAEEDDRVKNLADQWAAELKELDTDNPLERMEKDRVELVTKTQELLDEIKVLIFDFNSEKEELITHISQRIAEAREEFEQKKSEVKLLGDSVQKSAVFNTRFKLGLRDSVIEESYDIGLNNIVIKPSYNDEIGMRKFLQVLLANAICNVKATNLSITIYDPNKFGQDLVSFYAPELEKLIEFKNEGFEDLIVGLKAFAAKNLKDMKGNDINTFNIEAEKIGRTPKEYKLLVMLSQPKTIEENEALSSFMSYSARLGVLVWLVSDKEISDTRYFRKPFDGVANPYPINLDTFGPKVSKSLIAAKAEGDKESLAWQDFINVAVPDSKIWSEVTDQFLDLLPGFYEGDPTQYKGYTVGNEGNVHILGVGGTGAGKSVFLNHLIATATKEYSPRDLELWMVDYKGSEFSFYLANKEHPKMLPHIKACLCTSDGDYAGSLYTALRKEAERRYKLLMEVGYKNIKEYNKFLRMSGRLEEIIPRILFVNDEFQVIFEKADSKIIEQIGKDITYISKVARAAGVHLFFTSQSMKGTIKDDILQQFTLRFALRCDEDVSTAILGTKYASNIKQTFGYLYVRSYDDQTLDSQKRYRTPFIPDSVLRAHIDKMADLAVDRNYAKKDVITYEETTKHDIKEVDDFYDTNLNKVPEHGLILLGSRMTYSANRSPDNIILDAENNSHIFATFTSTGDIVNFYRTISRNIANFKKSASVFINSQVADLHYVCELDKDVSEEQQYLSNEKASIYDLFAIFQRVYDMRVSKQSKEDPAYFILIGWDKADGFGIDKDSGFTAGFAKLLQLCGEYNMHFVFITADTASIGNNIIGACKYKICGKCSEDASYKILNTKQGSKVDDNMKDGYMYINRDGAITRAKIYRSKLEREIKKSEFVM